MTFVSLITATRDRREEMVITKKFFLNQTYPQDKMEWIVYDDGEEKIKDIVSDLKNVRYFSSNKFINLGQKKKFLNRVAKGDIIIYFDDRHYSHPERVAHTVERLEEDKGPPIAGCSLFYIYFPKWNSIRRCGPVSKGFSFNCYMAYKKMYLYHFDYDESNDTDQIVKFTNNYRNRLCQLNAKKTCLLIYTPDTIYPTSGKSTKMKLSDWMDIESEEYKFYNNL